MAQRLSVIVAHSHLRNRTGTAQALLKKHSALENDIRAHQGRVSKALEAADGLASSNVRASRWVGLPPKPHTLIFP